MGCGVLASEYRCAHGAQRNVRDLTPYLTYDCSPLGDSPRDVGRTFELWSDEEENPASLAIPAALAPAAHLEGTKINKKNETSIRHRVPTPLPPATCHPSTRGKAGSQKSFDRGNCAPPLNWDRRTIQPNHIKFRTCSALEPL